MHKKRSRKAARNQTSTAWFGNAAPSIHRKSTVLSTGRGI